MYPRRRCPDCNKRLRKSRIKDARWFCYNDQCSVIYVDFEWNNAQNRFIRVPHRSAHAISKPGIREHHRFFLI